MSAWSESRIYTLAFLGLIILLAFSAAILLLSRPDPVTITINPPAPTSTPAPTDTPAPITVYITGAVAKPEQLIQLAYGSRVSHALAAAGGLIDGADKSAINMAAIIRDGDQIHVQLADASAGRGLATPSGGKRVYVNTASQAELETLPGIGPTTARRIIQYRELAGDFENLADLDNVTGIGPTTLEKLENLLAFD